MAENVTINCGGCIFEISSQLIFQYPQSRLAQLVKSTPISSSSSSVNSPKPVIFLDHNPLAFGVILDYLRYKRLLVPKNVAREIVELQLSELGIPYDTIVEEDNIVDVDLPSYEAALGNLSAPYRDEKSSLRDTVYQATQKRLDTLIQDVILPYLKRHAKRGHQRVTFYLIPNSISPQAITAELEHRSEPHEWIHLPSTVPTSSNSLLSFSSTSTQFTYGQPSSVSKLDENNDDDLPDMRFLSQKDSLDKLEDLIVRRSGIKSAIAQIVEASVRTENEFGLIFTKTWEIVEIFVTIL